LIGNRNPALLENCSWGQHAVFVEQRSNEGGEIRIFCAQRGQPGRALRVRQGQRLVQLRTHFMPAFGVQCGHRLLTATNWGEH
jgi:hypothetical protein